MTYRNFLRNLKKEDAIKKNNVTNKEKEILQFFHNNYDKINNFNMKTNIKKNAQNNSQNMSKII